MMNIPIAVIDVKPYASDMECFMPLMEKYMKFTLYKKEMVKQKISRESLSCCKLCQR